MSTYPPIVTGTALYATELQALRTAIGPAEFITTGSSCAALRVQLESGYALLIVDSDSTLSWDRATQHGWAVGIYGPAQDVDDDGECVSFIESATVGTFEDEYGDDVDVWDNSADALLALIASLMSITNRIAS